MKLYLSSIDIPTPDDLSQLLGEPLAETTVAFIPNANDLCPIDAHPFTAVERVTPLATLGTHVMVEPTRP